MSCSRWVLPKPDTPYIWSGLYALPGTSATATAAAWANRLLEPMTKVSNVYRGFRCISPSVRRSASEGGVADGRPRSGPVVTRDPRRGDDLSDPTVASPIVADADAASDVAVADWAAGTLRVGSAGSPKSGGGESGVASGEDAIGCGVEKSVAER